MVKVLGKKEVSESVLFDPTSTPTAEKGKVYFDSTASKLKVSEDGSTFTDVGSTSTAVTQELAEHEIEIIELQANATVTPFTHDTLISDTYSDSNGYQNTVSTTNTTATFDTNKYKRTNKGEIIITSSGANNLHFGGTVGDDFKAAQSIKATSSTTITEVKAFIATQGSPSLDAQVRLETDNAGSPSGTLIAAGATSNVSSGSITGSFAEITFTIVTPPSIVSGTTYWVVFRMNGAADGTNHYRIQRNSLSNDYADGSAKGATTGDIWSSHIYDLKMKYTESILSTTDIIEHNLPSISGTVTATQLIVNDPDRETGDSITYDILDITGTADISQALNTKNTLTNPDGTKFTFTNALRVNLIAYYEHEESAGTIADNSEGTASLDGTITGTVTLGATGKVNNAFDFGGGYIDVTSASALDLQSNFSVSTWINSDINATAYAFSPSIISKEESGKGWNLRLNFTTGKIEWLKNEGTSVLNSTTSVLASTWYLVTITFDGTTIRMYVNGIEEDSAAFTTHTASINNLNIGRSPFSTARLFNGRIDEVGIWARNLTSSEVTDIYNSGSGKNFTTLFEYSSKIKINLIPKSGTPTNGFPSVKTYALKIWKV